LVGEVFRLLQSRRIPWVLLENVPFMLQLSRGRAMEVIVAEMERLGYRWAYRVVNSRAFGLPQRRERVIFLASLNEDPRDVLFADEAGAIEDPAKPLRRLACGFYWTEGIRGLGWAVDSVPTLKGGSTVGIPSPPAIVMPDGRVVTPHICDAERMQGFEAGWTEPASLVMRASHRWKLVGNAVTVEVARWVGDRLRSPSPAGREVTNYPLQRTGAWPRAAWNVDEKGRRGVDISAFPVQRTRAPLHEWLQFEPTPLSLKATAGFLSRAEVSSLRFADGFLGLLRAHLRRMERAVATERKRAAKAASATLAV
jgi:DNA (cytosine-5)-methyltransferase 1